LILAALFLLAQTSASMGIGTASCNYSLPRRLARSHHHQIMAGAGQVSSPVGRLVATNLNLLGMAARGEYLVIHT